MAKINRICRFFIAYCLLVGLWACTSKGEKEETIPVIRFKLDEAQTLKMSELFDGYEVLTFKGIECNQIGDFVKIGDQIVATSLVTEGMVDIVTLCVFDSVGEFQHTLGKFGRGPEEYLYLQNQVLLTPDSNIMAMDVLGLHCYALDGTLLWQNRFDSPSFKFLGYPVWMLNDSCIVYNNSPCCGMTYTPDTYLVNLFSWKDGLLKGSYFPAQKIGQNAVKDHFYVVNDTLCYYSDIDYGVYNVLEDTITLRYRVNKGIFKGFCPCDDMSRLLDYLAIFNIGENNKYVLVLGTVNSKYYLFVYDKIKKETYTYNLVDDDLLSIGHISHKSKSLLRLYNNWKPGIRQGDDYMYFYFAFSDYCMMLNRLKAKLSKEQWEQYQQEHPDLMKIYHEQGEEGNTVVLGYRFK